MIKKKQTTTEAIKYYLKELNKQKPKLYEHLDTCVYYQLLQDEYEFSVTTMDILYQKSLQIRARLVLIDIVNTYYKITYNIVVHNT